jgi:hypothetical protein
MTTGPQTYCRRQLLRANIAGFLASILDDARVPNVLWGEQAADIFNDLEESALQSRELEYVIPDEAFDAAIRALDFYEEHQLCLDSNCASVQPHQDFPVPDAHFHTPCLQAIPVPTVGVSLPDTMDGQDVIGIDTISIFVKSKVLWWLPDFTLSSPKSSIHMMSAKEYRRWSTDWQASYPFKILKPMVFVEALIMLLCRDHGNTNSGFKYWQKLIYAMTGKYFPEEAERPLRPDFRSFWLELTYAPKWLDQPWDMLQGMRERLILAKELSPVEFQWNGLSVHPTRELVDLEDLQKCAKVDGFATPLTLIDRYMKDLLTYSFMHYSGR